MNYTKGEWKFKREEYIVNDVFSSVEAGDIKICYLKEPHYIPDTGDRTWYNGKVEVMKANAQLIALSPRMAEFIQGIVKQDGWLNKENFTEAKAIVSSLEKNNE